MNINSISTTIFKGFHLASILSNYMFHHKFVYVICKESIWKLLIIAKIIN